MEPSNLCLNKDGKTFTTYPTISQSKWQTWYNDTCAILTCTINNTECLLHKCLRTMKDICDIDNRSKFSNIRLKASYFVAMLTWELSNNDNVSRLWIDSQTYENLIKYTVALTFYDNNGEQNSHNAERFMKVQWLIQAMQFVLDNMDYLKTTEKTSDITTLQKGENRLSEDIDDLDNSTAPFVETVLHAQFNTTTSPEDENSEETVYQRTLRPPTSSYEFWNRRRESILKILQGKKVSFDETTYFFSCISRYMMYKPTIRMQTTAASTIIIDISPVGTETRVSPNKEEEGCPP